MSRRFRLGLLLLLLTGSAAAGTTVETPAAEAPAAETTETSGTAATTETPAAPNRSQCPLNAGLPEHWPPRVREQQQQLATLPPPDGADLAGSLATDILAAPEFGAQETDIQWQLRWRYGDHAEEKPDTTRPDWWPSFEGLFEFFAALSQVLGTLGHVLLWLLLLALLILLWRQRHVFRRLAGGGPGNTVIAGLAITPLLAPDALPEDVVAGAEHLWQAGHPRDALSLLYRAALHRLGWHWQFAIPESGTETECLALVRRHAPAEPAAAFRILVNAWMQLAWQHQPPAELAPLVTAYRQVAAGIGNNSAHTGARP